MAQSWYQQLCLWMQEKHCSLDKARNFFKKKHMGDGWCILKIQSLYWDQISASSVFVRIVLYNRSVETSFDKQMYLKIGLPLIELQETRDILYIKSNLKTFEQTVAAVFLHVILFTLLYLQCMEKI